MVRFVLVVFALLLAVTSAQESLLLEQRDRGDISDGQCQAPAPTDPAAGSAAKRNGGMQGVIFEPPAREVCPTGMVFDKRSGKCRMVIAENSNNNFN